MKGYKYSNRILAEKEIARNQEKLRQKLSVSTSLLTHPIKGKNNHLSSLCFCYSMFGSCFFNLQNPKHRIDNGPPKECNHLKNNAKARQMKAGTSVNLFIALMVGIVKEMPHGVRVCRRTR